MSSTIYGPRSPAKEHLSRSKGTLGEIKKLRDDVEKSLGAGLQFVLIPGGGPTETLTTSGTSIVQNTSGGGQQVILPNAPDGTTKRVVNGVNGQGSNDWVYITGHNNLGNDWYDLPPGASVDLAYVEDLGGWVATNYCNNVNFNWD